MSDKIKVKIILGSTRSGRFGEKPARWLLEQAKAEGSFEAELLDLRDYPMPFFDDSVSPSRNTTGKYPNPTVQKWADKIREADAFIIVTPEYNHGYPAVLKNALDVVYLEWNNKPVGFVGYGSVLGARAIEQLRGVAIELQMAPIRNAIHIPGDVYMAAAGNGGADLSVFKSLRDGPMGDRVAGFFTQLAWWASALKAARQAKTRQ